MSSATLPALPSRLTIQRICEETANRERVDAAAVEKDFYLTRLIWAIAQKIGDSLLLKGGTLLSKVDLGYYRMSEDIDLVLPVEPGLSLSYGTVNVGRLNDVHRRIATVGPEIGVKLGHPDGLARYANNSGRLWEARYESVFEPGAVVLIEVTISRALRPARRAALGQLAGGPLSSEAPFVWALDADEARAEKVRAAYDRSAIRDFYDLYRLSEAGADFESDAFRTLVDAKLNAVRRPPLAEQPARFGKSQAELAVLERDIDRRLAAVLRWDEPRFDLEAMLDAFDRRWGKSSEAEPRLVPSSAAPAAAP